MGVHKVIAFLFVVYACANAIDDEKKRELVFEQMLVAIMDPHMLIVDLREPVEVLKTGRIGFAINIPLKDMVDTFLLPQDMFLLRHGRPKPDSFTQIVFYSNDSAESKEAMDKAFNIGFVNALHYPGGWNEWLEKTLIVTEDKPADADKKEDETKE